MSETPLNPLRARMIEDTRVRKFGDKTRNDYIRHVKAFSTFLGRSHQIRLCVRPSDTPK